MDFEQFIKRYGKMLLFRFWPFLMTLVILMAFGLLILYGFFYLLFSLLKGLAGLVTGAGHLAFHDGFGSSLALACLILLFLKRDKVKQLFSSRFTVPFKTPPFKPKQQKEGRKIIEGQIVRFSSRKAKP